MINLNKFPKILIIFLFLLLCRLSSALLWMVNDSLHAEGTSIPASVAGFPFSMTAGNISYEGSSLVINGTGELDISSAIEDVKLPVVGIEVESSNASVKSLQISADPVEIGDFVFLFDEAKVEGDGIKLVGEVNLKGVDIPFEDLGMTTEGIEDQEIEIELEDEEKIKLKEDFGVFTLVIEKIKLNFEGGELKITADGDCDVSSRWGVALEFGKPQPFEDSEFDAEEGLKPKPIPRDALSINFADGFYLKIHQIKLNFEMDLGGEPVEYRYLIGEENRKQFISRPDCKGAPEITGDTIFYKWEDALGKSTSANPVYPAPGCIVGDPTYVLGTETATSTEQLLYGSKCPNKPVKKDGRFKQFVKLSEIKSGTVSYDKRAVDDINSECFAPTPINKLKKPTYSKKRELSFSIEGQATLKLGPFEFEINKIEYNPFEKEFKGEAVLTPYTIEDLEGAVEEIKPSIYGTIEYTPTKYFVVGDASSFKFYHAASSAAKGISEANKRELSIEDALSRGFNPDTECFTQHDAGRKTLEYLQQYQGKYIIQGKKLYQATSAEVTKDNLEQATLLSWDDAKVFAGKNFEQLDNKCLGSTTIMDKEPGTEQGELKWELGGQVSFKIPALSEEDELTVKIGVDNKFRLVLGGEVPLSKVTKLGPFSLDKVMVTGKIDVLRRLGKVPDFLVKKMGAEEAETKPYLVYIDGSATRTIYLPSEDAIEKIKEEAPSTIKFLQKTSDIAGLLKSGYKFSDNTKTVLTASFARTSKTSTVLYLNNPKICTAIASLPKVATPTKDFFTWERSWDLAAKGLFEINDECFTAHIKKKSKEYEDAIMIGVALSFDFEDFFGAGGKLSLGNVAFDTEEGLIIEGEYELPEALSSQDNIVQFNKISISSKIAIGKYGAPDSAKGETSKFELEAGVTGTLALKQLGFGDLSFENLGVKHDKKGKWKLKGSLAVGKEKE